MSDIESNDAEILDYLEAVTREETTEFEQERARIWKESVFAVGLTNPTWKDDLSFNSYDFLTAFVFQKAGRVGNMVVLRQTTGPVSIQGQTRELPQLKFVLGPYWYVPFFLTIPFIIGGTIGIMYAKFTDIDLPYRIIWAICLGLLSLSLFYCSTTDPGIMYRYDQQVEESWTWNDQALTYRPKHAKYDSECAVIIEKFDHVCPWTGTAIGKKNMIYFRAFTSMVLVVLIIDVMVLATFSR